MKIYHNDTPTVQKILGGISETGFNVLNWSYSIDFAQTRELTGGKMCLMGNVDPLSIVARGTPEQVKQASLEVLRQSESKGIILSVGGGTSPGTPKENLRAMIEAVQI